MILIRFCQLFEFVIRKRVLDFISTCVILTFIIIIFQFSPSKMGALPAITEETRLGHLFQDIITRGELGVASRPLEKWIYLLFPIITDLRAAIIVINVCTLFVLAFLIWIIFFEIRSALSNDLSHLLR